MYLAKSFILLRGILSRQKIEADLRNHLLKQVFTTELEMWYRALLYIYLWGLGACSLCQFSSIHSLNPYCLVIRTTTSYAYKRCRSWEKLPSKFPEASSEMVPLLPLTQVQYLVSFFCYLKSTFEITPASTSSRVKKRSNSCAQIVIQPKQFSVL